MPPRCPAADFEYPHKQKEDYRRKISGNPVAEHEILGMVEGNWTFYRDLRGWTAPDHGLATLPSYSRFISISRHKTKEMLADENAVLDSGEVHLLFLYRVSIICRLVPFEQ